MTATRDFDESLRAWLDLMPDEAPDRAIARRPRGRRDDAAAAGRAARSLEGQHHALASPLRGRWPPSSRWRSVPRSCPVRTTSQSGIGTTPTPVPSAGPSASATPGPVASELSDVPAVLRQDWEANVAAGDLPALGAHETQIQLSFAFATPDEWIQTGFGPTSGSVQWSSTSAYGSSGVRLVSAETPGGCTLGDDARYQWAISGNGLYLKLTAVSDPCASRRSTLERTWVHSLGARSLGGPGVLSDLRPDIQMTLPAASWGASGETGAVNVESDTNRFVAIKNPAGFSAPCSGDGGQHIAQPATIAGYTAYIQSMPGFHVTSTNATIGGKPAVHLAITTTVQPGCPFKLFDFAPNTLTSTGGWFIQPGDPDTVWLVRLGRTCTCSSGSATGSRSPTSRPFSRRSSSSTSCRRPGGSSAPALPAGELLERHPASLEAG